MIKKIKRFFSVNNQERNLFIRALLICTYSRLLIFFVPMKWYAKRLGEQGRESPVSELNGKSEEIKIILKAMRRALRFLPGRTKCLAKAITLKSLLGRNRIPSTIYLGVAKEDKNKMIAHAWLRCGTEILTGKEEMPRFTVVAFFT
jgi:hypothetical protein